MISDAIHLNKYKYSVQVLKVKQGLKRKAAESDLPTKYLVAEAVGGLDFESRAKLNCGLNAMHKMARLSRAAAQQHPTNPTTLEDLVLPGPYVTATSGEPLLLWDSGYTTEHRRSFLFGTPQNTATLHDTLHASSSTEPSRQPPT